MIEPEVTEAGERVCREWFKEHRKGEIRPSDYDEQIDAVEIGGRR